MAPPAWPFGTYPAGGLERLGPHVVAYYADAAPLSNSAIVTGTEATLVFDPNVLRFARTLRAAVEAAAGPPLRHLVLSHCHADHAYGIAYFVPPAEAWASGYTGERLQYWQGRGLAAHAEEYRAYDPAFEADMLATRLVVPQRVVETPTLIELGGGVRVTLYAELDAHTPADLWAFVEPDGVALCGDLWFNGVEPYFGHGTLAGSLAALRDLREARATVYLPGHGPAAPLQGPHADPMERLIRWLSQTVPDGLSLGLRGDPLKAEIRTRFETQAALPGGIDFRSRWAGFLEDGVEKVEADLVETA